MMKSEEANYRMGVRPVTAQRWNGCNAVRPTMLKARTERAMAVAYIVSRFPRVSETFVLLEMTELMREGIRVELFPLRRTTEKITHTEARQFIRGMHWRPLFSRDILSAQWYWLCRHPWRYVRTWILAVAGSAPSFKFLSRAFIVAPMAAWMAREMLRTGVQHVHAHFVSHPGLAALCVHRLSGLPYTLTAHAHDIYRARERPMLRSKIRHSAITFTISDYNRRLLTQLCGIDLANRIKVLRCGVDLDYFRPPVSRVPWRLPVIACVGNLYPYKGHRYLVQACGLLVERGLPFLCICIGQGPLYQSLAEQIRHAGLCRHVLLVGPRPQRHVRRLFSHAVMAVQPSVTEPDGKTEGIPVALMEAMAMELPVVATAVTGTPELVEHGVHGLLVAERDAAALAAAMEMLLRDADLRARMGRAGRQRIAREYNRRENVRVLAHYLSAEGDSPYSVRHVTVDRQP